MVRQPTFSVNMRTFETTTENSRKCRNHDTSLTYYQEFFCYYLSCAAGKDAEMYYSQIFTEYILEENLYMLHKSRKPTTTSTRFLVL